MVYNASITYMKGRDEMALTTLQVEKLLKGNNTFSQLGFSMLVTRFKKEYATNPTLPTIQKAMGEINAFIGKYQNIITNDLAIVAKL